MRGVNDDEVPAFVELTRHAPLNVSVFFSSHRAVPTPISAHAARAVPQLASVAPGAPTRVSLAWSS